MPLVFMFYDGVNILECSIDFINWDEVDYTTSANKIIEKLHSYGFSKLCSRGYDGTREYVWLK